VKEDLVWDITGYGGGGFAGVSCELDGGVRNGEEGLEGLQMAQDYADGFERCLGLASGRHKSILGGLTVNSVYSQHVTTDASIFRPRHALPC